MPMLLTSHWPSWSQGRPDFKGEEKSNPTLCPESKELDAFGRCPPRLDGLTAGPLL